MISKKFESTINLSSLGLSERISYISVSDIYCFRNDLNASSDISSLMPKKRKVFAHPKAILLKFEEGEFLSIETRLQAEREKRPHLARTELLREWILVNVQRDEKSLSDKPVPCRYCGRLWPEHKLQEHEKNCGQNPQWKGKGIPGAPSGDWQQLVEMRRWWDSKLAEVEGRFTTKVEVLEQFLFRDRAWEDLFPLEKERLLRFFLNPAIGAAPKQFRPVQFKEYLTRLGVKFDPAIVQGRQDAVAVFLQQQMGNFLLKNEQGFYVKLK
ncbi:MAG: hypothetical protein RBG13Loki_1298 [Promethearchaeota archaeon CR_4]|nr:MAG: hypothetical protein RBG13Loki_1298 [Candidatus Lokiarchaeota archaeon CR_4]